MRPSQKLNGACFAHGARVARRPAHPPRALSPAEFDSDRPMGRSQRPRSRPPPICKLMELPSQPVGQAGGSADIEHAANRCPSLLTIHTASQVT